MKGILLAGGAKTRLYPTTAICRQLLCVCDKYSPATKLQYVLRRLFSPCRVCPQSVCLREEGL